MRTWFRAAPPACALAAALSGCVTGDYNRRHVFQPPPAGAVDALTVGTSDVGSAVSGLGAPVQVVEVGEGLAMVWGWEDVTDWNVDLSVPVGRANANFRFTSADSTTRGVVLFFDRDWRLSRVEEGFVTGLFRNPPPPRSVDLIEDQ